MHHGTSLKSASSIPSRTLDPLHELRVCNVLLRVNTRTHEALSTSDRAGNWFFFRRLRLTIQATFHQLQPNVSIVSCLLY
jgi:hypothetical protein